jgi:SAM-dependent methyltransferase
MAKLNVVRGHGLLDVPLAKLRQRFAYKALQQVQNRKSILDIGCGNFPFFLINADFPEKFGLEKDISTEAMEIARKHNIHLTSYNIESGTSLPFREDSFDAITMIAVVEHIEPSRLVFLFEEVKRVLKPSGLFVITTPAHYTGGLLQILAFLRLASSEEIKDHKASYSLKEIARQLETAGFRKDNMQLGHFEMFLNSWATATK